MGRVERIGEATLYLGDCREILPSLGPVDAVVTDPPYGIGFPYNSYEDTPDALADLVASFLPLAVAAAQRVVVTPGTSNIALYPRPLWTAAWTWETTATYGALGYSQWQPILFYGEDLKGFGSVNGVVKSDRIHFTGGSAKIDHAEGDGHTCPKPLAFIERLLSRFTMEGETVCDPFLGSGTTGVACARMSRAFVGVEIDERYFDIACRRIEEAYRQPRLFAEPVAKVVQDSFL
jgi:site-specific DNA-methyltransferase (adenine-specific)